MPATPHRANLRRALEQDPRPVAAPGDRLAAVLALLIEEPEPSLLFTERAPDLNRHAGEVSFPGGLSEPQDAGLVETALRETNEEIGLDPALTDVLGALPAVHTFVSGILVTPFVGAVRDLPPLRESAAEIARVLTVATRTLASVERRRELRRDADVWTGWSYDVGDATVWGATGAMLHAFLELAREGGSVAALTPEDRELRALLGTAHTIAVVGLSSKPGRPSYGVATYLQDHGYRIVPVNPNETRVLGEPSFPSLLEVPAGTQIDVVDVFRRAEHAPDVAKQAVARAARVLWLQEGIVSEEAAAIAEAGGMDVIMGVCIRHVRERLMGGRSC